MSGDLRVLVKAADMDEQMQQTALEIAQKCVRECSVERDIAMTIKKSFDARYEPQWHCIVGRSFGSYVAHEARHFIYFYVGQFAILLFKAGN